MNEISFEKMVLATTISGEKMVGTFGDREDFEAYAGRGRAVELYDVRNLTISEVQNPVGGGQVMVSMAINLLSLPPFALPVPAQYVRLSGWIYLGDYPKLYPTMIALIAKAERREKEMRASAAGIQLVPAALKDDKDQG
jgi:hypothetical protein